MNKLFSKKLWTALLVAFMSLLVVFIIGSQLAFEQSPMVNSFLKATTFKVIKGENSDNENTEYYPSDFESASEVKEYALEVCREVEGEGIVLLKNENNALPLASGNKLSCFFYNSVNLNYATSGSSTADSSGYGTLKAALESRGYSVNPTLWNFYENGGGSSYKPTLRYESSVKMQVYKTNAAPWSAYSGVASSISEYGDAAIAVIGRNSGEGQDVSAKYSDGKDGSYISITEQEEEVLKELAKFKEKGSIKKIIVLLNTALAMNVDFVNDQALGVDACLWIGNLGSAGVYSAVDVLCGKIVPSGRLTDTYVVNNFSSPAMAAWMANANGVFSQVYVDAAEKGLNDTQKYYGVYTEGIYVGYRYYETRYADIVEKAENAGIFDYGETVAYPFGYGLSYTQFAYDDFTVNQNVDGDYEVSVKVTNIGSEYSGKEVVQIYLQKPYTDYDRQNNVEKSAIELVGFAKTDMLAPGAYESVTVTVEKSEFKSYDTEGFGTYILDAGKYYLSVGKNAHDALNNVLALKGNTVEDGMDSVGNADLAKCVWDNPLLDSTTYAVSEITGNPVTNRLDFCDVNRYDGLPDTRMTYVSRNDWVGTWPTTPIVLGIFSDAMGADISSYKAIVEDPQAKAPSYGIGGGITLAMLRSTEEKKIEYNDEMWERLLSQMSFEEQAKLVTDCAFNTPAIGSVSKPKTTEQDGPTGVSNSINGISFPSEGIWAASFNTKLIAKVGDALAEDARANKVHGMYLPGINIHRTPFGGRVHEYFSEDPFLTGISSEAEIIALQAKGVVAHVKHYIFNDEEANRNGIGIWLNEQSAREIYLKPWEYAVKPTRGNAHGVMSSFNRAGCKWTSADSALMTDILRGEWAFDGYVITDMASSNGALYMTFVDGFMNGTDCFLGAGGENALKDYKSSVTFRSKINESAHRILYVIANYSWALNGISSSDIIIPIMPWWGVLLITLITVFAVLSAASIVMFALSAVREKRKHVEVA